MGKFENISTKVSINVMVEDEIVSILARTCWEATRNNPPLVSNMVLEHYRDSYQNYWRTIAKEILMLVLKKIKVG